MSFEQYNDDEIHQDHLSNEARQEADLLVVTKIGDAEFCNVKDFHLKFGHLVHAHPVHLTKRKLLERIKFLQEELDEFTQACGFIRAPGKFNDDGMWVEGDFYDDVGNPQDLALQADALVDLVYVAKGTAVMQGLPWLQLWEDVQRANMAKQRGIGHRGNLVDCVKPEGWVGPRTLDILVSAGYDPTHASNISFHRDDSVHLENNNEALK